MRGLIIIAATVLAASCDCGSSDEDGDEQVECPVEFTVETTATDLDAYDFGDPDLDTLMADVAAVVETIDAASACSDVDTEIEDAVARLESDLRGQLEVAADPGPTLTDEQLACIAAAIPVAFDALVAARARLEQLCSAGGA